MMAFELETGTRSSHSGSRGAGLERTEVALLTEMSSGCTWWPFSGHSHGADDEAKSKPCYSVPPARRDINEGRSCSHSWLTQPLRGQSHLLKSMEVKTERVARQSSVIFMLFSNYFLCVDSTYCLGQKFLSDWACCAEVEVCATKVININCQLGER